ncbi:GNAT family N-acetyltransferase [Nocardia alni]|uniref:GNAT family N-acetyltransferase n=1 Tax=Nocardia alni TaxID=2815723 RepID=UPI001C23B22A|nr:GNAT family N-acetyltransferase [Nocardia alni]
MDPTIRTFDARDQDAVVALSIRAWEPVFASLQQVLGESGVFAVLYRDWRSQQADAVRQAHEGVGMRVQVAEIDSAVVGFVAAHLHHDDGIGEVHRIVIDPDHQ